MSRPNQAQRRKFDNIIADTQSDLKKQIARLTTQGTAAKTLGLERLSANLEIAIETLTHANVRLQDLRHDLGDFVGNPAFASHSIADKLTELLDYAKMDNAGFGFPSEKVSSNPHMEPPIVEMNVTDFIKEKTRVYRETLMIPLILELLEIARSGASDERVRSVREAVVDESVKQP